MYVQRTASGHRDDAVAGDQWDSLRIVGGESWSPARVIGNALLVLRHPENADTVSLRVRAGDADGNTVEETILDAYRLR